MMWDGYGSKLRSWEQSEAFKKIEQLWRDPELMQSKKDIVSVSAAGTPSRSNILKPRTKMVGDKDVFAALICLTELMRSKGVDPATFARSHGASDQAAQGSMLDSLEYCLVEEEIE